MPFVDTHPAIPIPCRVADVFTYIVSKSLFQAGTCSDLKIAEASEVHSEVIVVHSGLLRADEPGRAKACRFTAEQVVDELEVLAHLGRECERDGPGHELVDPGGWLRVHAWRLPIGV